MFIYRKDLATQTEFEKRRALFVRKGAIACWPAYLQNHKILRKELVKARARGDRLAKIERGYSVLRSLGIRGSDGSLLIPHLLAEIPPPTTKARKLEKPRYPLLYLFPEGHELQGLYKLFSPSKRLKFTRRTPAR